MSTIHLFVTTRRKAVRPRPPCAFSARNRDFRDKPYARAPEESGGLHPEAP
jgi:hypothetical protein